MANRYAVATGNWSNTATWAGGTLPGPGDTVRPNGYTVTIDQDVTVSAISFKASSPAVAGGKVLVSGSRIINADLDVYANTSVEIPVLASLVVNGNVVNTVNAYGGSNQGIYVNGGDVVVNGSMTAGNGNDNICMKLSTGTATVNGTVSGGTSDSYCIYQSGGTLTINGDVLCPGTGGGSGHAVYGASNAATLIWTGGHTARGNGVARRAFEIGGGVCDLEGIFATPLSGLSTPYTWVTESVRVNVGSTGKARLGGVSEIGGIGIVPMPGVSINSAVGFVQEFRSDANWPTSVYNQIPKYLYDRPNTDELPAPADVREGVAYNTGLADVGTLVVPLPEHVAFGVETDDTVGEAVLRAEDIWAVDADSLPDGSVGKRMAVVSTVESTGAQIAAALDG